MPADETARLLNGPQESIEPDYDTPDVVADKYGNELLDVGDEQSDDVTVAGQTVISAATMSYLVYGAYNADFRFAPPEPGKEIDENNPLPYWQLVNVQGGIRAKRVEDSNTWSGYAVEWTATNPSANDEAYFEQIVPIDSSELWGHFRSIVLPSTTGTTMADHDHFIEVEYYDAAGSAVGGGTRLATAGGDSGGADFSAGLFAVGYDAAGDAVYVQEIPEDAKYAALRFGVVVNTANEPDDLRAWVGEVFHKQPTVITPMYWGLQDGFATNATGTNLFTPGDGDWTTAASASHRYVAPWAGFVTGASQRHASARSTGNLTVYAHNVTTSTNPLGPSVQINATYPQQRAGTTPLGSNGITVEFVPDDQLIAKADTVSWAASGTNENFSSYQLACFELMNYSS